MNIKFIYSFEQGGFNFEQAPNAELAYKQAVDRWAKSGSSLTPLKDSFRESTEDGERAAMSLFH